MIITKPKINLNGEISLLIKKVKQTNNQTNKLKKIISHHNGEIN